VVAVSCVTRKEARAVSDSNESETALDFARPASRSHPLCFPRAAARGRTRQSARTTCLVARQGLSADPARAPACCRQDYRVAGGRWAAGAPGDLFAPCHCGSGPARHVSRYRQACGLPCKLPKKTSTNRSLRSTSIGSTSPTGNFGRCARLPQNSKEILCLRICTKRLPNIMSRLRRLIGLPRSSTAATIM